MLILLILISIQQMYAPVRFELILSDLCQIRELADEEVLQDLDVYFE